MTRRTTAIICLLALACSACSSIPRTGSVLWQLSNNTNNSADSAAADSATAEP